MSSICDKTPCTLCPYAAGSSECNREYENSDIHARIGEENGRRDMSKYILELKDDVQVVQKVGVTENGNAFVMNFYKDQLEELTADYINEHFGDLQDTAYQKGFEKGKDVRIKGCEGCMYQDTTIEHNPCNLCCNAFLNRWKAKSDKIEVGDEVNWLGDCFIVTRIFQPRNMKEQCDGIDDDGCVYHDVLIKDLEKTGRHFDIASILEDMRND